MPRNLLSTTQQKIQPKNLLAGTAQPKNLLNPPEPETQIETNTFLGHVLNFFIPSLKPAVAFAKTGKEATAKDISQIIEPTIKQNVQAYDVPFQAGRGYISGRTFGLTDLLTADWTPSYTGKEALKEITKPKSIAGDVSYRMAHLLGMIHALPTVLALKPFQAFNKWQPTTTITTLAKRMLKGGMALGTYSILSEQGGKDLKENLKARGLSGAGGFSMGAFFSAVSSISGDAVQTGARTFKLDIPDNYAQLMAFIMRLGLNEMVTGVPAIKNYIAKKEHLPGAIYEAGLGLMFSLSSNPLYAETELNKALKQRYELERMSTPILAQKIEDMGEFKNIPSDIKWAYIMKTTSGKIRPSVKNAPATDFIFEDTLRINNPETYNKLDFVRSITTGIEEAMKDPDAYNLEYFKRYVDIQPKAEPKVEPLKEQPISSQPSKSAYFWSKNVNMKNIKVDRVHNEIGLRVSTTKLPEGKGKTYEININPKTSLEMEDVGAWDNPQALLDGLTKTKKVSKSAVQDLKLKIPNPKDPKYITSINKIEHDVYMKRVSKLKKEWATRYYLPPDVKKWTDMERKELKEYIINMEGPEPSIKGGTFKEKEFYADQNRWFKEARNTLSDMGYDSIKYIDKIEKPGNEEYILLNDKAITPIPEMKIEEIQLKQPPELAKQEQDIQIEMATDKDIKSMKRLAKKVGLLYRSKTGKRMHGNLNRFLAEYFDIRLKDVKKLTKEQISQAREYMLGLTPDKQGKITLPKSKEILPLDVFQWSVDSFNPLDWLQTARMPLRPIYDILKPAYTNYIKAREFKIKELRSIYGNRVKRGDTIDQALAQYADGLIELNEVPKKYQDIAIKRKEFYDRYADTLLKRGFIKREKVFDKSGERKPYYHRIFDIIIDNLYNEDFTLDDLWLPGKLPTAGPLRRRTGAEGYKYSALESDMKYVYAVEKYINMKQANDAAISHANLLKGTRKQMANIYVRYMRGQPSDFDKSTREGLRTISKYTADILDGAGLHNTATKLRNWNPPAYPVSRVASPLARFYYWRYVGLAVDTSFKNSIQWQQAMARYGPQYISRAMYEQYTPEMQSIIKESGILEEGIRRGGHFIEESIAHQKLSKLEDMSYAMWNVTDTFNRQVSGVAAYLYAKDKGMSHPQAIGEMRNGSHETQYGYTKADSLLLDMSNPLFRFILFKKWPLAKVEMIRQWAKDGHSEAIFNLALQEYAIYRVAQKVGADFGPMFSSIWQLATRGLESPAKMIAFADELVTIHRAFQSGNEGDKARQKLIRAWQGLGNRYIGKVVDVFKAWENNWEVRDYKGQLQYKTSPWEQTIKLFTVPLESTKRRQEMELMDKLKTDVQAYREKAIRRYLGGDVTGGMAVEQEMMDKYAMDFFDYYGKTLQPIDMNDINAYLRNQESPSTERLRKSLPGKSLKVPLGQEFPKIKERPLNLLERVRGY